MRRLSAWSSAAQTRGRCSTSLRPTASASGSVSGCRRDARADVMNTRRQFLIRAPLGFLVAAACHSAAPAPPSQSTAATPGAPPTFGTGPGSGPEVTPATFAEAEKLMQVTMTPADRQMAAESWRRTLAALLERRTGPRKVALDDTRSPATVWSPSAVAHASGPAKSRFVRSAASNVPLPANDADIAFAPVTQ